MITLNTLEYPLGDGFIHNWLIAGPRLTPISTNLDTHSAMVAVFNEQQPGISESPADRDMILVGGMSLRWGYWRCQSDHWVNVPVFCATPQVVSYLGYAQLRSPVTQQVTFELAAAVLVEIWLNGQCIYRAEQRPESPIQLCRFSATLRAGDNEVLLRTADVGVNYRIVRFALRITELSDPDVMVCIPTHAEQPKRQQRLERLLDYAYLEDIVNHRGAHFNLRWADDLDEDLVYAYQIQDANEAIYVDGKDDTEKSRVIDIGQEYRLFERPYFAVLKAVDVEYYGQNLRYQRSLPIHVLDTAYAASPYGSFQERQKEALVDAAKHDALLFAQIARMQLDRWGDVDTKVLFAAAERVQRGEFGSEIDLLGLLGMIHRFGKTPDFPVDVLTAVQACIFNAVYSAEGADESTQICNLTCEFLAGQRYPDVIFAVSGQSGIWHRERSEGALQTWLQQRGKTGFASWDSNSVFPQVIAALAHLISFAENEAVSQFALALLDKTFFLMAVNSFKGAYGCSHGKTNAGMLKSAQLEATSGLMSMLWGTGVFNHHIVGTVSLACSTYEFPLFIGDIANDLTSEMWSRERHQLAHGEVNKVAYRTSDYLLASAQDYRPGQLGNSEHVWQATFGPDAVVFVTHPACMSEHEANRPGFWLGNAILPRVAQWKDVLISIHSLPDDDWMGFTHAYFPIYAFEEYAIDEHWAFARVGDGYLALTAANGLAWVKHAPDGYRELRSYGEQNIWLCHMGRTAQDGSFEQFQHKIRAMKIEWGELAVGCETLRGDQLAFGWEGALLINGQEQVLAESKHVENPYCTAEYPAESMEISFQGTAMRLSFD